MKLGFVSAILDTDNFEEMTDAAKELGLECVEVACWPQEKAERRYAGVSHIDTENLTTEKAEEILAVCRRKDLTISALAYYPNTMDSNLAKREANIKHLYSVIDASAMLGVNLVTTFIGRDQYKTVEENLKLMKEIWPPILEYAAQKNVRIAIENCPMLFGSEQWPGGQNIFTSPVIWRKVFEILPYENLGINFDPSHFIWQMMDYILPIYEFKDKIFHVHCKDIHVCTSELKECGVLAYPLDFMKPKMPGLGDVDWGKYVAALTAIGYEGYVCIEAEDRDFEGSREKIMDGLKLAKRYLRQYII